MLLQGIDHVATLTNNGDELKQFYVDVFDATIEKDGPEYPGGPRMIIINLAPGSELNVLEVEGNTEPDHQTPMFGRGPNRPHRSPCRRPGNVRRNQEKAEPLFT